MKATKTTSTTTNTIRQKTKKERVLAKLTADKELSKGMAANSDSCEYLYEVMDAYIKALKEGRLIASVESVSRSGMTRRVKFFASCRGKFHRGYRTTFFSYHMSMILGWKLRKDSLIVEGCGMDMIFHTNDCMIRTLQRYGFVSKKQADKLISERITCI